VSKKAGNVLAAMFLTIFRGIEDREAGPGFDKIWGRLDFLKSAFKKPVKVPGNMRQRYQVICTNDAV
jgi:hypothetical protein